MFRPLSAAIALSAIASFLVAAPTQAATKPSTQAAVGGRCIKVGASAPTANGVALKCSATKRWAADTLPAVAVTAVTTSPTTMASTPTPTATLSPTKSTANITSGCATNVDPSTDYFPEKASILDATNLQVRYEHNYKVVTVPQVFRGAKATSWVLVQCGTPAPKLEGDLAGATIVNVPIASAAIMSTTLAPSFEIVGTPEKIVAVDDPQNYSTPSVVKGLAAGTIKGVVRVAGRMPRNGISLCPCSRTHLALADAAARPPPSR